MSPTFVLSYSVDQEPGAALLGVGSLAGIVIARLRGEGSTHTHDHSLIPLLQLLACSWLEGLLPPCHAGVSTMNHTIDPPFLSKKEIVVFCNTGDVASVLLFPTRLRSKLVVAGLSKESGYTGRWPPLRAMSQAACREQDTMPMFSCYV